MPQMESSMKRDMEELFARIRNMLERHGSTLVYRVILMGVIVKFLKWLINYARTNPKNYKKIINKKVSKSKKFSEFFNIFLKEKGREIKKELNADKVNSIYEKWKKVKKLKEKIKNKKATPEEIEQFKKLRSEIDKEEMEYLQGLIGKHASKYREQSYSALINKESLSRFVKILRKYGIKVYFFDTTDESQKIKSTLSKSFEELTGKGMQGEIGDQVLVQFATKNGLPPDVREFFDKGNEITKSILLSQKLGELNKREKEIASFVRESLDKEIDSIEDGKETIKKTVDNVINILKNKYNIRIDNQDPDIISVENELIEIEKKKNNGIPVDVAYIDFVFKKFADALTKSSYIKDTIRSEIVNYLKDNHGIDLDKIEKHDTFDSLTRDRAHKIILEKVLRPVDVYKDGEYKTNKNFVNKFSKCIIDFNKDKNNKNNPIWHMVNLTPVSIDSSKNENAKDKVINIVTSIGITASMMEIWSQRYYDMFITKKKKIPYAQEKVVQEEMFQNLLNVMKFQIEKLDNIKENVILSDTESSDKERQEEMINTIDKIRDDLTNIYNKTIEKYKEPATNADLLALGGAIKMNINNILLNYLNIDDKNIYKNIKNVGEIIYTTFCNITEFIPVPINQKQNISINR